MTKNNLLYIFFALVFLAICACDTAGTILVEKETDSGEEPETGQGDGDVDSDTDSSTDILCGGEVCDPGQSCCGPPSCGFCANELSGLYCPDTCPEDTETGLPDSMKGYELYSWEDAGTWYFTLITGTNRTKTEEEITAEENTTSEDGFVKITVAGEEPLLDLLSMLPPASEVLWCTSDSPQVEESTLFALPGEDMVQRVEAFCEEHQINLSS